MRVLKFRAWNKASSIMHKNVGVHPSICCVHDDYSEHEEGAYTICQGFTNYEIMQFTGLNDKNGVSIYEGDLLLVSETRICEVIFHNEAGCWDLISRNILSSLPIGAVSPASYQYHTEVIGNIYQNPELLK